MGKIDVTSSAVEKGIDLAKGFLDSLIKPAVEETGLLLRDQVTLWRFKKQVSILNKANQFCQKNNISPKTISLKLLCPLLENASLEEDEFLENKWAILLSNLVDSDQNIQNHVFPYILGQISTNEYMFLDLAYENKIKRVQNLTQELREFKVVKKQKEKEIELSIKEIEVELNKTGNDNYHPRFLLRQKKNDFETELRNLKIKENKLQMRLDSPEIVPDSELREFEVSNLTRLGLIKTVHETIANPQTLDIPIDQHSYNYSSFTSVDLEVDLESYVNYVLTELGELFVNACTEKDLQE